MGCLFCVVACLGLCLKGEGWGKKCMGFALPGAGKIWMGGAFRLRRDIRPGLKWLENEQKSEGSGPGEIG